MERYETVIGLEIHVQLKTKTKMFCSCSTLYDAEPNSMTCPVCLGLPGALPSLNQKAVEFALRVGLALGCEIHKKSSFDRKNYFYPDMPKGYQITQFYQPICTGGQLELLGEDDESTPITIKQIHMEEDAAKLTYEGDSILIDFNRAGIPLLEIVTNPCISSPREAEDFLMQLKTLLEYLEISDCNMEEGSLRCDANISLREVGASRLGTKTELKNMNSFKALRNALEYEQERQLELLRNNKPVRQETRSWDETRKETFSMRKKEETHQYRYFPEPDLPELEVAENILMKVKSALPELPQARYLRLQEDYGISSYAARVLTSDKDIADLFEIAAQKAPPLEVSKWVLGELLYYLNEEKISLQKAKLKSDHLAELINLIEKGTISNRMAKEIFSESFHTGLAPGKIVAQKGLQQIASPVELLEIIDKVIGENTKQVEDYLQGNERIFRYLVGQVMKYTKGKANPRVTSQLLSERLTCRK